MQAVSWNIMMVTKLNDKVRKRRGKTTKNSRIFPPKKRASETIYSEFRDGVPFETDVPFSRILAVISFESMRSDFCTAFKGLKLVSFPAVPVVLIPWTEDVKGVVPWR